jgi:putative transposase
MSNILLQAEGIYHIYTHANGFENLFQSEENYRYFLAKYRKFIYPVAETYAYCLMPNHFHLLVKIRSEAEVMDFLKRRKNINYTSFETEVLFSRVISLQFSHWLNGYTQAYNKMYKRMGSLFVSGFKRKVVGDERYLMRLLIYIHNNSVHHGFTDCMSDWKHSSLHAYLNQDDSIINPAYFIDRFGGIENFKTFHQKQTIFR